MVNKNDIRYIKTDELICSTYLNYYQECKKPITVTELCRLARINKSTFYMHYENIDELHQFLRRKIIHKHLQQLPELPDLFSDINAFTNTLGNIIDSHILPYKILFPNWMDIIDPLEEYVLEHYLSATQHEDRIPAIRFCIGGMLRLLDDSCDQQTINQAIQFVRKTLS